MDRNAVAEAVTTARSLLEAGAPQVYLAVAEDGHLVIDREVPPALITVVARSLDQVRRFAEGASRPNEG